MRLRDSISNDSCASGGMNHVDRPHIPLYHLLYIYIANNNNNNNKKEERRRKEKKGEERRSMVCMCVCVCTRDGTLAPLSNTTRVSHSSSPRVYKSIRKKASWIQQHNQTWIIQPV